MTPRARVALFGGCGVLVAAGIVCAAVLSGVLAAVLAFVLIGTGMVLATSLVFLEVGLSEDRDRERMLAEANRAEVKRRMARRQAPGAYPARPWSWLTRELGRLR